MLSESAKNSGMYCAITSTSVENEDVEFSMKTVAIFGPGWYVSVYYWALACEPKSRRFDPQSGAHAWNASHVPS